MLTDGQTDTNRFYNLSHAICNSYGADNTKTTEITYLSFKVYFICLLIREYDVIDLVANWKLGQDETKLNSHRISRLDKTEKSWTCSVSKFSVADSLDLLWIHFTPQTWTRQDSLVLSVCAGWNRHKRLIRVSLLSSTKDPRPQTLTICNLESAVRPHLNANQL